MDENSDQTIMATYQKLMESGLREVPPAKRPVLLDLRNQGDALAIFFTGKHDPAHVHGFNYLRMTKSWPINKIYVRDVYNLWYHANFEGIGPGIGALQSFLKFVVEMCQPARCVAVGGSMGGYAALLFGALMHLDGVLAFGPQTCLSPRWRLRHGDTFLWALKQKIYRSPARMPAFYDLRDVLLERGGGVQAQIHLGYDRLDQAHARHVEDIAGIQLVYHDTRRHDLSRVLNKKGGLESVVNEFVNISDSSVDECIGL